MDQKTDRLYTSAPFEIKNSDFEQRLEKKINDVNSFKKHINNIKEMTNYFKDKNNESKKKYKKYKTITTILKLFDAFVIFDTTASSTTLSLTGIGLIVIPISTAPARALLNGNKVKYEIIINKYNKYKKLYEKDRQTIKFFDNLYTKSIQSNIIDETEQESLCNIFTKNVDENKMILFSNLNKKNKLFW